MCLHSEEAVTMSCGFTKANYSHCPLKKRPVYITDHLDETTDADATCYFQSEPENLSTKPEDLRLTCQKKGSSRRAATTCFSHVNSLADCLSCIDSYKNHQQSCHRPILQSPQQVDCFLNTNCDGSLKTNKSKDFTEHCQNTSLSKLQHVSIYYPYNFMQNETFDEGKLYYFYPTALTSEQPFSPYFSSDKSTLHHSPPYASTFTTSHPIYQASDSCGLSPASSSSSPLHSSFSVTNFPPGTQQEISPPGSVAGSEGSSNECTGCVKKNDKSGSRYQCPFCSKSYSTFSGLSNHQALHHSVENEVSTGTKSFSCKYCEKVYVTSGALKMHIRTHTLPCKCVICGKAFSRPWLLQGHTRTHTGEKPFSCPLCNRAFADRSNLRAHLQTHCEVKKYSCSNCGKSFSRMSLLTKHQDIGCSLLSESTKDHVID